VREPLPLSADLLSPLLGNQGQHEERDTEQALCPGCQLLRHIHPVHTLTHSRQTPPGESSLGVRASPRGGGGVQRGRDQGYQRDPCTERQTRFSHRSLSCYLSLEFRLSFHIQPTSERERESSPTNPPTHTPKAAQLPYVLKDWAAYSEVKTALLRAHAEALVAQDLGAAMQYGEQVARLTHANGLVEEAKKKVSVCLSLPLLLCLWSRLCVQSALGLPCSMESKWRDLLAPMGW